MCLIISDTLLTPSSRFFLSSQQEDETTVIKEDNDQCQPVGLAWYLLWCHILVYNGLWPMPKSTHSRQMSDRLPFIRMTSLCYLITFHGLFQVWEFSPMNLKSSLGLLHHQSQNKCTYYLRHTLIGTHKTYTTLLVCSILWGICLMILSNLILQKNRCVFNTVYLKNKINCIHCISFNSTFPFPWFSHHRQERSYKLQGRIWSVCLWRKLRKLLCELDIYNQLLWLAVALFYRASASQDPCLSLPVGQELKWALLPTS